MRKTNVFLGTMRSISRAAKDNVWRLRIGLSVRDFTADEVFMLTAIHMRDINMKVYAQPHEEALVSLADDGIICLHRETDDGPVTGMDLNLSGMQAVEELKNRYYSEFITAVQMMCVPAR